MKVQKQNEGNNKNNSEYKTRTFQETYRGKTYNWTVSSNEISDEATKALCKLIYEIF